MAEQHVYRGRFDAETVAKPMNGSPVKEIGGKRPGRPLGRPWTGRAMTAAERQRAYRDRKRGG